MLAVLRIILRLSSTYFGDSRLVTRNQIQLCLSLCKPSLWPDISLRCLLLMYTFLVLERPGKPQCDSRVDKHNYQGCANGVEERYVSGCVRPCAFPLSPGPLMLDIRFNKFEGKFCAQGNQDMHKMMAVTDQIKSSWEKAFR